MASWDPKFRWDNLVLFDSVNLLSDYEVRVCGKIGVRGGGKKKTKQTEPGVIVG